MTDLNKNLAWLIKVGQITREEAEASLSKPAAVKPTETKKEEE
jgi:hypothetical protein